MPSSFVKITQGLIFSVVLGLFLASPACSGGILMPMDLNQSDHLKAYGVVYRCLQQGVKVQWLLNYRGGSFLTDENQMVGQLCNLRGVSFSVVSDGDVQSIYGQMEAANMERIELEKAPKLAVYVSPTYDPWDDAVRLALDYAEVPYTTLWDEEVMAGALSQYDWLHLHHEDFTGQYGKFYLNYQTTDWYRNDVKVNTRTAQKLGYKKVSKLKLAVGQELRKYLFRGGFLFAMCSAPSTLDIALAAAATDIVPQEFDGDPVDQNYAAKLDFSQTLAFRDFLLMVNPHVYEHSDIDVNNQYGGSPEGDNGPSARGANSYFSLFDFSAKYDPISCMLVQNHVALVREFMGQDTGFRKSKIKPGIVILAEVAGSEEVKYLHGIYGQGSFAYYGGHDPEDYQHIVGDPATDLRLYRNSPGYRLILNNILFPAAKKKQLKT